MGLVVDGRVIDVPGVVVRSWLDDPALRLRIGEADGNDGCARGEGRWVRAGVLHTTKGIAPQLILGGAGDPGAADITLRSWSHDRSTPGGAHIVVDRDGSAICCADLQRDQTYHAGSSERYKVVGVNGITWGLEMWQGPNGELYEATIKATVRIARAANEALGIQWQIPRLQYRNKPIARIQAGGADVVGIYGHRNQTPNRGAGDPGDAVFEALLRAGAEPFDLDAEDDLAAWRGRQRDIGVPEPDGVAGPRTVAALRAAGRPAGIWSPFLG